LDPLPYGSPPEFRDFAKLVLAFLTSAARWALRYNGKTDDFSKPNYLRQKILKI
jgi:hypothetical protein